MKDGVLLINKACGPTSHDVVAQARRKFKIKEIGHGGTLDPMAGGLLVLLLGQATKLSSYILGSNKSYVLGASLGIVTDTLDLTGQVKKESPHRPNESEVYEVARSLQGKFQWPIPHYSAAKVGGEKLYERARRGEEIEAPTKLMDFWGVEEESQPKEAVGDYFFSLSCSKGSFIRSWVSELGERLGCGATLSFLQRTSSGDFRLDQSLRLEQISERYFESSAFVPIEACLHFPRLVVRGMSEKFLRNGQISHDLRLDLIRSFQPGRVEVVQILDSNQELRALAGFSSDRGIHLLRVFLPGPS